MMNSKKLNMDSSSIGNYPFDIVLGFDMETDIGSYTPYYEGVQSGTPLILEKLEKHNIHATFFWTGYAAENNTAMVRQVRDAGHEIGCHGLSILPGKEMSILVTASVELKMNQNIRIN